MRRSALLLCLSLTLAACAPVAAPGPSSSGGASSSSSSAASSHASSAWTLEAALRDLPKTDAEWRARLTPEQYAILREEGTERPFTSPLLDEHRKGTFVTADCGEPVFRSEQKYDSGTGWPSFWAPISADAVVEVTDSTFGMTRTEIRSRCGGHLGHVFTDGPEPTGLRYCMNGDALIFIPDAQQ
jgi:peptide-methionine (R)-S-oxide reductase